MTTGTAPLNGAGLYCGISGKGQTLVLLHDGLLTGRDWDDQFEAFSERYRTTAKTPGDAAGRSGHTVSSPTSTIFMRS